MLGKLYLNFHQSLFRALFLTGFFSFGMSQCRHRTSILSQQICLFLSFWFYIGQWYTFLNFIPFHIATLCFCIIMLLYQRFIFFQSSHFWFSVSICHKSIFNILCKLLLHSLKRKACHSVLHFSNVRDSIDHPGFCLGKEKFRFECYLNCIPPPSTISN